MGTIGCRGILSCVADNVTLRSESGQRDNVVLDGQGRLGELVGITGCSGVTIADLTVQNVKWNGIKLNSDRGVNRVTIYNCVIHNVWQRGIKGVMVPQEDRQRLRPSDCRVQYCLFYNDRPKRFEDDEADRPDNFGGNYIGGIDVMYAQRWTISDNVFVGIQGRTGEARGAIFLWVDARDCVVERNIVIDCDSGICLGNSSSRAGHAGALHRLRRPQQLRHPLSGKRHPGRLHPRLPDPPQHHPRSRLAAAAADPAGPRQRRPGGGQQLAERSGDASGDFQPGTNRGQRDPRRPRLVCAGRPGRPALEDGRPIRHPAGDAFGGRSGGHRRPAARERTAVGADDVAQNGSSGSS